MSDKRHRRKRPNGKLIGERPRRIVQITRIPGEPINAVIMSTAGNATVVFNRGEARILRDWLNHFLEYAATFEAEGESDGD